jgi:glycosyltransferase involved in cell wall biosynthesis
MMKIAYVMGLSSSNSELWMKRQLIYMKDYIGYICAIDGNFKKLNGVDFYNLYYDYPVFLKALIRLGVIRERSREERFSYVFSRTLVKRKPDVVFINYLTMAYKLKDVLASYKGKVYVQIHGFDVTWDFVNYNAGKPQFDDSYRKFARSIQEKVHFIANSCFTKEKLVCAGVKEKNISIKYFGVPCNTADRAKRRDCSDFRILYLGRLIDCKGPDLVIRAFNLACLKGLKAELIIAGNGPLFSTCDQEREKSPYKNRIKLVGEVSSEEGQRLRDISDVFTAHNCKGRITRQEEAFGVSIIEAMAAGLPVVTGRSGGLVESVIHGETGFLFEPGDIEAHANYLLALYQNEELRLRLARHAIDRVKNRFTIEREKNRLLEILDIRT